jgi:YjbE family integral membrane protein
MDMITANLVPILQIVWIDLLLSGDNAVVIALACRQLPPSQRKLGMVLGAGTAIVLRIIFALIITQLLAIPFLKLVGGLLLLWIGVKLAMGEEDGGGHEIAASENLWRAVRTIAIADAVMSLDNVIAIAGAADGNVWLFIFGLLLSIPLIIYGSVILTTLIARYPILVWFGAALLGWIAGEMLVTDGAVVNWIKSIDPTQVADHMKSDGHGGQRLVTEPVAWIEYTAAAIGAALVVLIAFALRSRRPQEA